MSPDLHDDVEAADPAAGASLTVSRRPRIVATVVLLATLLVVLVQMAPWFAAGIGDSHDGRNAGTWGLASQSLRDHPLASHLGGIEPDGKPYADHPPLIVFETAITAGLSGDRPLGVRMPAIASSIAALILLWYLLREAGLSDVVTAAAIATTATSAMFVSFGAMLDTPIVGLPFGVAALLMAQRAWHRRPAATWLVALVGLGAGLSSWEAALCAVVAGGIVLLRRPGRVASASAVVLVAATLAGAALSLGWAAWAYGSLHPLFDQAGSRAGAKAGWFVAQRLYAEQLFGWLDLGIIGFGAVTSLLRRQGRSLLAISGFVAVGYAVLFRQGSTIHVYWNYWALLVLAIATAVAIDGIMVTSERFVPRLAPLVVLAISATLLFGSTRNLLHSSPEEKVIHAGAGAGDVLRTLPHAAKPTDVAFAYFPSQVPAGTVWGQFITHGHSLPLTSVAGLDQLAKHDPMMPVMVAVPAGFKVRRDIKRAAFSVSGDYLLIRASALAALFK